MSSVNRHLRDCVIVTSPDLVITEMNPAAEEYLGEKEWAGKTLKDLVSPLIEKDSVSLDDPARALDEANKTQGVTIISTPKGERRTRYTIVRTKDGVDTTPAGFTIILEDHGRAEKPDEDDTKALATAIEHAAEAIVITDKDGVIEYVNPAFETVTGYSRREVIGKTPNVLKSGQHPDTFYKNLWNTVKAGKVWQGELTNKRKSGELYIDRASIAPIYDERGEITHFVSVKRDITERIKAVEELRKSHELLDAISRAQSLYIGDSGVSTVFEYLLKTTLNLTGSEYGVIAELVEPQDDAPYLKANALTNIAWNEETSNLYEERQKNGGMVFSNLNNLLGAVISEGKPIISNNPADDPRRGGLPEGHPPLNSYLGLPIRRGGRLIGMVGVANRESGYDNNVVESLEPLLATCANLMEAAMAKSEQAAAEVKLKERAIQLKEADALKHKMISIVSHDLRSPFASNIGLLKLLESSESEPLSERQRTVVETMIRSLGHQLSLVENLLELSRIYKGGIESESEPARAINILKESAEMLEGYAQKKEIEIRTEGDENLWINVDRERVIQVVNNLVTNGVKFTERGGLITLAAENEGDYVALRVTDTGVGVAPANIPKLLDLSEQMFTLGTEGERGTGLGLNICQELTELNGGRLAIESKENEGTTITILFPPNNISQDESA